MVVFVSGVWWGGVRGSDRHMAEALSERVDVLFVESPTSVLTPIRYPERRGAVLGPRSRRVTDRICLLSPLAPPGMSRRWARRCTAAIVRHQIRRAVRKSGRVVKAVVVGSYGDYLNVVDAAVRVLYVTDDLAAGAALLGLDPEWLARQESRALAAADVIVTVSPRLHSRWTALGLRAQLITNGVDTEAYARVDEVAPAADVRLSGPVVGLVGTINARLDVALLEAVADRGFGLLIVGPMVRTFHEPRLTALLGRHNVQWVGAQPFESLPSYLRCVDVGITPYRDTEFNRASFPLKTLEYLAAGRAVVSTDLPALRWLVEQSPSPGHPLVRVASDPESFADAVAAALIEPRTGELMDSRRSLAARHSWQAKALQLTEAIGLCTTSTEDTP